MCVVLEDNVVRGRSFVSFFPSEVRDKRTYVTIKDHYLSFLRPVTGDGIPIPGIIFFSQKETKFLFFFRETYIEIYNLTFLFIVNKMNFLFSKLFSKFYVEGK